MDGWMDGWMHAWMHACVYIYILMFLVDMVIFYSLVKLLEGEIAFSMF